jgi:predicted dehydrogenase
VERVRTGVLGCGSVSRQYLPIVTKAAGLEVLALADVVPQSAEAAGGKFGISSCVSPIELLEDPAIELIINLTPITAHFETTAAALAAGKHVYSEKPLATSAEQAGELLRAAATAGRVLACAPDTPLGTGFSAARRAMDNGDIGTPLAAGAYMLRAPLGDLSAPSGGALAFYDMAPYYLTALVNLFGPARQVTGFSQTQVHNAPPGDPRKSLVRGTTVIEFSSGTTADLSLVWGINHREEVPLVVAYGTDGELRLPNPNAFGEPAAIRHYSEETWRELPGSRQPTTLPRNLRGIGVAELARAIRENRTPAADGQIAAHVVEIIDGMISSARTGRHVELMTRCQRAGPLDEKDREELLEGVPMVA